MNSNFLILLGRKMQIRGKKVLSSKSHHPEARYHLESAQKFILGLFFQFDSLKTFCFFLISFNYILIIESWNFENSIKDILSLDFHQFTIIPILVYCRKSRLVVETPTQCTNSLLISVKCFASDAIAISFILF